MTNLKQIQEENRKLIITAIHGCDYEEASEKEWGIECQALIKGFNNDYFYPSAKLIGITYVDTYVHQHYVKNFIFREEDRKIYMIKENEVKEKQIIGKPITLDRVLLSLDKMGIGYLMTPAKDHNVQINISLGQHRFKELFWDLTKPTLEEQEKSTQRAINQLMR